MFYQALKLHLKTQSMQGSAILLTLEKYTIGAIIQFERIQSNKIKLLTTHAVDSEIMNSVFLDIHFYFICCEKVQNLIEKLSKIENDTQLSALWYRLFPQFKKYNDARNHLEHIDERTSNSKYLRDFGNLVNDNFTFGGESFDVSQSSLKFITDSFESVLGILRAKPDRI